MKNQPKPTGRKVRPKERVVDFTEKISKGKSGDRRFTQRKQSPHERLVWFHSLSNQRGLAINLALRAHRMHSYPAKEVLPNTTR
ncbi:hypothetical protein [Thalassovita sp.]|jgi:hypothetical protein|uniref:hypothetical protein n=1 Tax=Thalassovita sp. TaxID=1979401 RepID=UPI003B5A9CBE